MAGEVGADRPVQAVILAAGIGRRLHGGAAGEAALPKIMLSLGGTSLLARHVALLRGAGIGRITLVLGFQAERIRTALREIDAGGSIAVIENSDFREGSVVSLWAARGLLRAGAPVLLMDADVLYDHRLLERLLRSAIPDCLLLDREIEPGDEPVKLCVRAGRIVDFRKQPTEAHDWHGESVGFFRFSPETAAELAGRAEAYVLSGRRNTEYEEPIRDMIMASLPGRFGFEDISGLPWTEIDFPEDVAKARGLLRTLSA